VTVSLRAARATDAPALAALDAAASGFPWSESQFAESLASHRVEVVEEGGEVVGFAVHQRVLDEAELLNIAVAPGAQGRGLGGRLLRHLLDAHRGVARRLFLEVRASNGRAIDLYQRHGFVRLGVRKGYYPGTQGREDAWIMAHDYP
jgi:ribosomal-protein-alanine acetyltransferase